MGWTDLLKYMEINLPPTLWCPWRLGPSVFCCLSLSQPQRSLCSHFWRKRLSFAGRARARARQADQNRHLLQGKQSCTLSSAIKSSHPTLAKTHIFDTDNSFRWMCMKIYLLPSPPVHPWIIFSFTTEEYIKQDPQKKICFQVATSPFYNICCHVGNRSLSHLAALLLTLGLHLHKLFLMGHMSNALLNLRQIIFTMLCLENEFSLPIDIKRVWQIYLWYVCGAFYSIFLLSHEFKYSS